MTTLRVYGKPRHDEPEFVPGKIGMLDFTSPSILVLPSSASFTVLDREDQDRTRRVYIVTMSDGTTRHLSARWVRKIGRVTLDETGTARWDE